MNPCVKSWQVYNFGNDLKIKSKDDVMHSAIEITYADNTKRIYEWGNDTSTYNKINNDGKKIKNGPFTEFKREMHWYVHPHHSFFGVLGQYGITPVNKCITRKQIDDVNEQWREDNNAGGQYPSNCRGYVHYIIRYLKGSDNPNMPLPTNDPASNSSCASSQYKTKHKRKSNNISKNGGKRGTRSRTSKHSRQTMKIRRTVQ